MPADSSGSFAIRELRVDQSGLKALISKIAGVTGCVSNDGAHVREAVAARMNQPHSRLMQSFGSFGVAAPSHLRPIWAHIVEADVGFGAPGLAARMGSPASLRYRIIP